MHITWLGHSCFKIEKDGYVIIMDPYKDGSVPGYQNIREKANLVICSHEHGDHNGRECIQVTEREDSPFSVSQIQTYHDDTQGSQRGNTRITILDDGTSRIAHFGDLGCRLTQEQEEMLTDLDLALIPVGGFYTIDGSAAADLVKKLHPKKVVPMHYRDDVKGYGYDVISSVDQFLEKMDSVVELKESTLDTDRDYGAQVILLQPKQVC